MLLTPEMMNALRALADFRLEGEALDAAGKPAADIEDPDYCPDGDDEHDALISAVQLARSILADARPAQVVVDIHDGAARRSVVSHPGIDLLVRDYDIACDPGLPLDEDGRPHSVLASPDVCARQTQAAIDAVDAVDVA